MVVDVALLPPKVGMPRCGITAAFQRRNEPRAIRKPPPHVAPLLRGADGAARPSLPKVGMPRCGITAAFQRRNEPGAMRKPPPHVAPLLRGGDGAARPSLPKVGM